MDRLVKDPSNEPVLPVDVHNLQTHHEISIYRLKRIEQ